jgi:hypothetical protein
MFWTAASEDEANEPTEISAAATATTIMFFFIKIATLRYGVASPFRYINGI